MHKMICCIYYHTNDDRDGWSSTIEVLEDCMYRIIAHFNGYWLQYARKIQTATYARKCMISSHNIPQTSSYCNKLDSAHY